MQYRRRCLYLDHLADYQLLAGLGVLPLKVDDGSNEGVAQAIWLAEHGKRMHSATNDELMSAAHFLAQALSDFPASAPFGFRIPHVHRELLLAGSAIAVELKRRSIALRSRRI